MMLGLLALIVVLAVHSVTLKDAAEGLKFYLFPDMGRARAVGLGKVITAAMNQAFFTLSLGIGSIEIFGSYMSKDNSLTGEAVRISALDTFVALMAGLIIFPACFSFGVQPDQGPSLIFVTLPNVFINVPGGRIWGTLFFLFMTFASFSTVTAVFENLLASCMDNFGWTRQKAVLINLFFVFIASIPCVLGYNLWSGLHLIRGGDVLDSEDFIVSNLLLPLGSLIFLLFCTFRFGWGFDNFLEEANKGRGLKMKKWMKPFFQFVVPVLILVILVEGLK
jgi:NSS family neurotransmitter:Na+ symporter